MDITKVVRLDPGNYVVAVSGGIDSMVLLHLLSKSIHNRSAAGLRRKTSFTVAHFDHGMRQDSADDRCLVQDVATDYGLPFVYETVNLGKASEDEARVARYAFLRKVASGSKAHGIVTAHHLDDVMETSIHNILRGTGRKGMNSLRSHNGILRPMTGVPKSHIRAYAQKHDIRWHEDSTNTDQTYRRNYIRHTLLPRLKAASPKDYDRLKTLIKRQYELNQAIDNQLATILHIQPESAALSRQAVASLPHKVATELVAQWLRERGKRQFDRRLVERLTIAIQTARPGTIFALDERTFVRFGRSLATFDKHDSLRTQQRVINRTSRLPTYSV